MQIIYLLLLIYLYTLSLEGFIHVFKLILGIDIDTFYLTLFLSVVGTSLGFVFYALSLLNTKVKRYIIAGVPAFISLMLVCVLFLFELSVFIEFAILLFKIGFVLMLCSLSLIGCYGLLKKHRTSILAAGVAILFFLFFTKLLLTRIDYALSVNQFEILLLFFILFICYLELGMTSIYYSLLIEKILPNKDDGNEFLLKRFNSVFNKYLAVTSIVLLLCYFFTRFIVFFSDNVRSVSSLEAFGIDPGSIFGTWFFVLLTIFGAFMFWVLIPREKTVVVNEKRQ